MTRRSTWLLAPATLVAAGCVSLPPAEQAPDAACADGDGDGYPSCPTARTDCDDGDATRHPGALEACDDGVDQDCDGADLPCGELLLGNTPGVELDPWTVSNQALTATFDRGPTADGITGMIGLAARGGAQLLATDPRSGERYTGVIRWDSVLGWRALGAAPTFTERLVGPAVVRVETTWSDGDGSGTSSHTLYPDGRIHRHDEVSTDATGDLYLSAYASLDPARIDRVDWDGNGAPVVVDTTTLADYTMVYDAPATGAARVICGFGAASGDRVSLAARVPAGVPGLRAWQSLRNGARTVGLAHDWVRGVEVAAGDYAADVLLQVERGAGACTAATAYAEAFLDPPVLGVGQPSMLSLGGDDDPDGDGYRERTGAYAVATRGARSVELAPFGALPSLALVVVDAPAPDPVVRLDGAVLVRGRDYHLQRAGAETWLALVRPLEASTTLRLEWP